MTDLATLNATTNRSVPVSITNPIPVSDMLLPAGAVALTSSSGNKANTSGTATLTPTSTTTAYITGFACSASGATAGLPVSVTVAGVLGGTLTYTFVYPAGALVGAQPLIVPFFPPLPASAVNTAIVVTLPASGAGGTNASVNAYGFYV